MVLALLATAFSLTSKGQLAMNEEYQDGYDHSLQNYITEKISQLKDKQEENANEGKKKWKIADYVTVPKFGGYIVSTYKYNSQEGKNGGDGFGLRYLRLYLDGTVFKDFKYRVQMNVSGEPGTTSSARVIDAFVSWQKWAPLGIKMGEFKRCFTFENPMNPWDIASGDYTQLTKHFAGMSATLQELLMSAEYIMASGNPNVMLCERGIRTFETATRNTIDLTVIPVLKRLSHLPVVIDPSHATGYAHLVEPCAMGATAMGADALIVEVHNNPSKALCDGVQSQTPEAFGEMMKKINALKPHAWKRG